VKNKCINGFSLVELILAISILVILVAIAYPSYDEYIKRSKVGTGIKDIIEISLQLERYHTERFSYPESLADIGPIPIDPWGNPYRYLNIQTAKGKGKLRKDHNLVPINSDYDLYSMGADGKTASPLTAKISHDDIIRGNNGGFVGIATDY